MYITNDPDVALIAEKSGVDRIWIDLETLGKEERQKNFDSVKSHHTVSDIETIAPLLSKSQMLVRIDPWNQESPNQIDEVINAGAQIVMLPYWKSVAEVRNFIETVDRRARTMLLLETREAVGCLDEVLKVPGIDEIHIGMNDLHLSYNLTFMFELYPNGLIEELSGKIKDAGIPFGIGGIGKFDVGLLPKPEDVIIEHYRLGSTGVILSRSFCNYQKIDDKNVIEQELTAGVIKIRDVEKKCIQMSKEEFAENKKLLDNDTMCVVQEIKRKKA